MEMKTFEKVEETLKKPNYRGIKAMPYVIGNETFEKIGAIGTQSNLLVYLTTVFHMNSITAMNLVNIFSGTCNFGTLSGALLSDTYFGRYNVLAFASVSSSLGMLILTLTAAITKLHPSHCEDTPCNDPTPPQLAFLFTSFGLMIIGASGIRPCNLAFGADQYDPNTKSGQAGISSFFNWYYCTISFALMLSLTIIIYVQSNVSWTLGLAIPSFLMILSCVFFFAGSSIYVKVMPEGSPLTSNVQVLVAATKKRKLVLPEEPERSLFNHTHSKAKNSKLLYTAQFRFLNKAAIFHLDDEINTDGSSRNQWRLCSVQQIEEAKCVIRTIPICIASVIYNVSIHIMDTYIVFQALQSNRRLGNHTFKIPAASYIVFQFLAVTIWIPIYDTIIIPFIQKQLKKKEGITLLQRMGIGIILAILTMLLSGIVEKKRRDETLFKPTFGFEPRKGAISSMSGYWLLIPLTVSGISQGFTLIGSIEFLYKQFPDNMRSFAGSVMCTGLAMSSYLASFLISVVHRVTKEDGTRNWLAEDLNEAKLDYFYYLCAGLQVLNLLYFLMCAKWYKYKEVVNESVELLLLNDNDREKHDV
ncbi:protein NRT1/ PTR FAMILY 2.10-like [Rutidosis leptorrhynchoides]|uniref:protein NRT1/ PTR FAMILY 2.10-like n=1 Tax=Rutidosis leptorrhynchoides TaxID=125765 RepID=UPI003A9A33AA